MAEMTRAKENPVNKDTAGKFKSAVACSEITAGKYCAGALAIIWAKPMAPTAWVFGFMSIVGFGEQ